ELKDLVAVVATLGELAALVTVPWDVWPFVYPESLRTALREFIWHLRDALEHRDVTSQAVAALVTTPGATWDNVTAVARALGKSRVLVVKSSIWLMNEGRDFLHTWEDGDTAKATATATTKATATAQAGDLRDKTAGWRRVKNILVDTIQQPSMVPVREELTSFLVAHKARVAAAVKAMVTTRQAGVATKRGQRVAARVLVVRLAYVCYRASLFLFMLQQQLEDIKLALKEKEVSADVREDLVAAVVKVKWLWEGSTCLAMHHLMGTLGDIHNLLSSPCGGSGGLGSPGGPVSPGGPSGRSVAKRCQETIRDSPRPCTEQRTAPSCDETCNGSSMMGTPEQPKGTWGKPEPGAVCDTTSHCPSAQRHRVMKHVMAAQ
ncbi:hypothetical protein HGM15179_021718, partial [Zosterops borbonicus]